MSGLAAEIAEDASVRDAIVAALHPTNLIPVLPLIEIIAAYVRPFRSVVTTVGPASRDDANSYQFMSPCRDASGEFSLLVTDSDTHCFRRMYMDGMHARTASNRTAARRSPALIDGTLRYAAVSQGRTEIVAGSGLGFAGGHALNSARFDSPSAIRVDPSNPARLYVTDLFSARTILDGCVSLVAGGRERGYSDGAGSVARFDYLTDFVVTSDGRTLLVCDNGNSKLRSIDTQTGAVTSVPLRAVVSSPNRLAFDRSAVNATKLESVVYATCTGPATIARINCETKAVTPFLLEAANGDCFRALGMASCASGVLLFTCYYLSSGVYAVDPATATPCVAGVHDHDAVAAGAMRVLAQLIAGGVDESGRCDGSALHEARFSHPYGLCVVDSERCVFVADTKNFAIRKVTLAPHYFP